MKNHLLWVGSFQSDEGYRNSPINNMGEASAYASQKGLLKGIDRALDKEDVMDSVNVVVNPPYPIYPYRRVEGYKWSRTGISEDICVGYNNIKYINYISRELKIAKEIKNWHFSLKEDERTIVIIYAASVGKLKGALYLKKQFGVKVYVILPDIPDFVNAEASKLVLVAKKVAAKKIRKYFDKVDGFILYSSYMANYYGILNGKWILMEGVFDSEETKFLNSKSERNVDDNVRKIMYCGSLDRRRSIPEILDMFDFLKDTEKMRFELWFVGSGNCDKLINEKCKTDSRIKNYGFINSREKVLELESNADILLYTREIESEGSYYCFPSKLFEYLMTGNPVACVRVPSISDDFFEYMHPIEEISGKGIYKAVKDIISDYSEYKNRADRARDFIINNKSSFAQGKRIVDFIAGKEEKNVQGTLGL